MKYRYSWILFVFCLCLSIFCSDNLRDKIDSLVKQRCRIMGVNHNDDIIFERSSEPPSDFSNVFLLRAKDATTINLFPKNTGDLYYYRSTFVPGRRFFCTIYKDKNRKHSYLYLVDTQLGKAFLIQKKQAEFELPVPSPDGTKIAFYESDAQLTSEYMFTHGYLKPYGAFGILDIPSQKYTLVNPAQPCMFPVQPVWSHDGEYVTFKSRNNEAKNKSLVNLINLYHVKSGEIVHRNIPRISFWYDAISYISVEGGNGELKIYRVGVKSLNKKLIWTHRKKAGSKSLKGFDFLTSTVNTPNLIVFSSSEDVDKDGSLCRNRTYSIIDLNTGTDLTKEYLSKLYRHSSLYWIPALPIEEVSNPASQILRESPASYYKNKTIPPEVLLNDYRYKVLFEKQNYLYVLAEKPVRCLVRYDKKTGEMEAVLKKLEDGDTPLWSVGIDSYEISRDRNFALITTFHKGQYKFIQIDLHTGLGQIKYTLEKRVKIINLSLSSDKNKAAFYTITSPNPGDPYWDTHEMKIEYALKVVDFTSEKSELTFEIEDEHFYPEYMPCWSEDGRFILGPPGTILDLTSEKMKSDQIWPIAQQSFWLPHNKLLILGSFECSIYNPETGEESGALPINIVTGATRPYNVQSKRNPYHFLHRDENNKWKVCDVKNSTDVTEQYVDNLKRFKYRWQEWDK